MISSIQDGPLEGTIEDVWDEPHIVGRKTNPHKLRYGDAKCEW